MTESTSSRDGKPDQWLHKLLIDQATIALLFEEVGKALRAEGYHA